MSGAVEHRRMKKRMRGADVDALIREIQRYLTFLDALRTAKHPPESGGGRSKR